MNRTPPGFAATDDLDDLEDLEDVEESTESFDVPGASTGALPLRRIGRPDRPRRMISAGAPT